MHKDNPLHLSDYFRVVWQRRWLIAGLTTTVVLVTLFFTFRAIPVYEASATIMLDTNSMEMSLFNPGSFYPQQNPVNNECELLRSRTISEKVYDKVRNNPATIRIFGGDKDLAVALFREQLTVVPTKNTDFINISFRTSDPELAAQIVNQYATEYRNLNIRFNRNEYSEVRKFIEKQLKIIEPKLNDVEVQLKDFKEKHNIVSLTAELDEFVKQWADFEASYNEAKTERISTGKRLDYLREQLGDQQKKLMDEMIDDPSPLILQVKKELVNLETELSILLVRGAPEDGEQAQMLEKKIQAAKARLSDQIKKVLDTGIHPAEPLRFSQELSDKILSLQVEWETAAAREKALKTILAENKKKMDSYPTLQLELARLQREYNVNEATYTMMMQKYEETKIAEAGEIGNVKVIDVAKPPIYPISPKKKLNLLMGLILGLSLAIGISFILEYADTTIKTIEDAEKTLRLAVLGSIPVIQLESRKYIREKLSKEEKKRVAANAKQNGKVGIDSPVSVKQRLITHFNPKSPISESYRTLRTNIQFTRPDMPIRTLAITSPSPKEGKSTTASNLAITMAQMGAHVLLVDTDLRKPIIHKLFGLQQERGITNILMEDLSPSDVIVKDVIPNLSVLPAGTLPPNPSELLGSAKMKELLDRLKKMFDYILFDTPPIVAVTDAAILSSIVDGTLLVISHGKTRQDSGIQAVKLLSKVNTRILGVVINNITLDKYFGKYSYYSYYHYYHEADNQKAEKKSRFRKKIAVMSGFVLIVVIMVAVQFMVPRADGNNEDCPSSVAGEKSTIAVPGGVGGTVIDVNR